MLAMNFRNLPGQAKFFQVNALERKQNISFGLGISLANSYTESNITELYYPKIKLILKLFSEFSVHFFKAANFMFQGCHVFTDRWVYPTKVLSG